MNSNLLIRLFGWRACLIHGDTTVIDRWYWLSGRLPKPETGDSLIEIGCGSGGFTIGAAKLGYQALGLSWDKRNQDIASVRATLTGAKTASFEILDVRQLDTRADYRGKFNVAVLCEVIEHILNDEKLIRDSVACLKPGGVLLLTTPNFGYKPITKEDAGPFLTEETGWHVRKGYTSEDLKRLAIAAGLEVEEISFCSGFFSQKVTGLFRVLRRFNTLFAWFVVLPLRLLPLLVDGYATRLLDWPAFSICMKARKPL